MTFVQVTQGGSPLLCGTRRINLYPVGGESPVPRSLMQQCEGAGLQGGWDHSTLRRIAVSGTDGGTRDGVRGDLGVHYAW